MELKEKVESILKLDKDRNPNSDIKVYHATPDPFDDSCADYAALSLYRQAPEMVSIIKDQQQRIDELEAALKEIRRIGHAYLEVDSTERLYEIAKQALSEAGE